MWNQVYNPFGNTTLSTIAAAFTATGVLYPFFGTRSAGLAWR